MEAKGVIYIPDISGFSKFVNETDMEHGQKIISELIEEIIASDQIGFDISEIEGDAVLYYKFGNTIPPDILLKQVQSTFNKFHSKIDEIKKTTMCNCNACSSIKNLKIKFIIHYDEMKILKIRNFNKLFGKGLVLAHRLLKNTINENEYILFTKSYFDEGGFEINLPMDLTASRQDVESFGIIDCYFVRLELMNGKL